MHELDCFNSLQTGKQRQSEDGSEYAMTPLSTVSIPFKRESISKVGFAVALLETERIDSFQFPSNGKAYPKSFRFLSHLAFCKFQFPSNGKAISKVMKTGVATRSTQRFQFPSNGKVYPKVVVPEAPPGFMYDPFQFPSNGKAYPKKS